MAAPTTSEIELDALCGSGTFRGKADEPVHGVDGALLARLATVPPLLVRRDLNTLRKATPPPADHRFSALLAAGNLFLSTVDGVPLAEHERRVSAASGVALPVVRRASRLIAHAAAVAEDTVCTARPRGTVSSWEHVRAADGIWVRRGEVLAVQAPGNHPATHATWLEALALGYRVAIRPSTKDPFTPHRLVSALRAAGFGADQVVLLPSPRQTADVLVNAADLAIVYGGDEAVANYRARADVLVQGPGRSKVLLAGDRTEAHLDTVVDSVSGFGATACVNASSVFVDGDAAAVAEELAQRLGDIPARSPLAEDAVLPAFSTSRAEALAAQLRRAIGGGKLLSDNDLVVHLPEGGSVLRAAVILLDRPSAPQIRIEFPFPCVWVAPWSREDGLAPLRDTLTLTAVTTDTDLLTQLAEDTSIGNLHIGAHPTHLMRPGLPHDGHLAEFLMKSKTVIRALDD